MLAARGVGLAQGFRFSRPVPKEQAAALVDRRWPATAGPVLERTPSTRRSVG
jgi:hypothetical protein